MPPQQNLFDTDPPEWEVDAAAKQLVATLVLTTGLDGEFDYLVPDSMADPRRVESLVEPGRRVKAPLGRANRMVIGYCVAVGTKSVPVGRKLKPLAAVVDSASLLTPSMLRLTRWMAEHYLCPWGQVLETVVPAGVRGKAGTRDVTLLSVPTRVAASMAKLELPPKQRQALQTLATSGSSMTAQQLAERAGCTVAPINALRKQGLIHSEVRRLETDRLTAVAEQEVERQRPKELNEDQQQALTTITSALDAGVHQTVLIHGVTGSGKTEVYIQAIERVVSFGRQAIVLVPEISLTPQTVGRFRERFDHLAVLHSSMSDVERHRHWRRISEGQVQVVIGARSAVFAPTPHLGLIVIDEEHENSFKQDTAPRYHARDVALQRTAEAKVPLILASATPSLESWVRTGPQVAPDRRFTLSTMPSRIGQRPMPDVKVVDMRKEAERGAISRPLRLAIDTQLKDRGQVILLLNRRGFSTTVQCPACGLVIKCEHCDVAMTFHRTDSTLICHWCDARREPPRICPDCKSPQIRYGGLGTQKLEAEVKARFPKANVLRMDTDTMRRPGSHEQALDQFRRGEADILLGTQMIAKGLDFPNVTLVGVLSADAALHFPDFRAAERTFQLVTQVAGRTGRSDRGGRVIVQCYDPDQPAIKASERHDFRAFTRVELPARQALGYPPFGAMARIIARGKSEKLVQAYLESVAGAIREKVPENLIRILGPAPAPIARLRGEHRQNMMLFSPDESKLREVLSEVWKKQQAPEGVRGIIDIDPQDMM